MLGMAPAGRDTRAGTTVTQPGHRLAAAAGGRARVTRAGSHGPGPGNLAVALQASG